MKSLRLLALALFAFACTATMAQACDANKATKTAKAGSTTTTNAVVASANGQVQAASAAGCPASAACPAGSAQCTGAMKAACQQNAAVAAGPAQSAGTPGCSAKGASATTASNTGTTKSSNCGSHGASAGYDHCGTKTSSASMAVAGLRCSEHQNGVAHDCSACEDWMEMDKDARAIGAHAQVVALKNGAMIVFTADTPAQVKQLQAMVAKQNERMTAAYAGASNAKLCDDCKQLRGAIASGKLNREVVNVERGVMALITSNDHAVVQRIRNMTGQPIAMR